MGTALTMDQGEGCSLASHLPPRLMHRTSPTPTTLDTAPSFSHIVSNIHPQTASRQPLCIPIDCATFQTRCLSICLLVRFKNHLQPRCVTLGDRPVPTCMSSQPLVLNHMQRFSLCIAASAKCHALLTCQHRPSSSAPAADPRLLVVL